MRTILPGDRAGAHEISHGFRAKSVSFGASMRIERTR
jgi:hypothetical protein